METLYLYTDINLMLFDGNPNTQTTTTSSVGNDLSPQMKTYYDKRLIDNAEPYLVHDQFAEKRNVPPHGGKTIEFRKFSPLPKALNKLTEGVTPDGNKLDVTTIEATVDQYGDYITISDVLDLTAIDPIIEETLKLQGPQAGRTADTVTREIVTAGTNVMYAPKADGTEVVLRENISADCQLTVPLIFKAVAKLKSMNSTPLEGGHFVSIVHPNVSCDLMLSKEWVDVHKYKDPEAIYEGEIGRIGKVRFVESTEAKIIGGAGADGASVYCTMVIGANAYGTTSVEGGGLEFIVKQKGSGGTGDPLNQRATTGWKMLKVSERLVEDYMVRIEHSSPTDPEAESN